jgi:hypothetical protein
MRTAVCTGHDVLSFFGSVDSEIGGGLKPTLALVFSSVALDLGAIGRGLSERAMEVAGVSSSGEIANGAPFDESCTALLFEADRASFDVRLYPLECGETMLEAGRKVGRFAVERFAEPVVLAFIAGVRANGEPLVPGVQDGAGRPIPLFGGVAGDHLAMADTYVFSGTGVSDGGVIALVLDGLRYQAEGIVPNGWQPVGIAKTVTRSEGNVVYTIDGRPALEVFRRYMELSDELRHTPGVLYPVRVVRKDGTSVLRPPLFYRDDQSIMFAGSVPQGSKVTFCIPPSIDIVERVMAEASELHRRIPHADAVIVVDCVARHLALGPLAEDEIRGFYDLWGAPMAGFFSYGEIGGAEPRYCDFHTQTCTVVALREIRK